MHGGGGTTQEFNDSQWRHMQIYYRDQKSVGGYAYLALRAPNNTWNGFYDQYVWPLVTELITQCAVCAEIDTSKVFLMGYSHGGYGAFAIGPNIPDRFAWVHASAAAPSPGISPAHNLRNVRFTYMIGERDTRYGRLKRCRAFDAEIQKIRKAAGADYAVTMEFKKGVGHGGLPDRDKIREMYSAVRSASPRTVTWRPTGGAVRDFYWLSNATPESGQEIEGRIEDNTVSIDTKDVTKLAVALDHRLVDLKKPLTLVVDGKRTEITAIPSVQALCESVLRRGDADLARTVRIELEMTK